MTHLSVCVVTHNEEKRIERCLSSVSFADEIVVVDSGSTDRTQSICKRFTDRVYYRQWPGFGPQKDFCFSLAQGEWILSVDADEYIPPPLQREIEAVVRSPSALSAYSIQRKNFIGNKEIRFGGPFQNAPDRSLKLFRKNKGFTRGTLIHEGLQTTGTAGLLKHAIEHHAYADLEEFRKDMDYQAKLAALEAFRAGSGQNGFIRCFQKTAQPCAVFFTSLFLRQAFRHGILGWHLALGLVRRETTKCRVLKKLNQDFAGKEISREALQTLLDPDSTD